MLPDGVRPVPETFQQAGYWTCIGSGLPGYDHRALSFRLITLATRCYCVTGRRTWTASRLLTPMLDASSID